MSELSQKFKDVAIDQIQENIKRIIMSYRNTWDIYSELLQNSVDAIIDNFSFENLEKGAISISIDTKSRKIIIKDNGIGIESSELSSILVLGESLKRKNNTGRFGFMGFGLSFIAFQTEFLKIESIHNGFISSRTYRNLYSFVFEKRNLPLSAEEENGTTSPQKTNQENGTTITIQFPTNFPDETIENNLNISFNFIQNETLFEYILRTKTAVGIVDNLFTSKKLFSFNLSVNSQVYNVEPGYMSHKEIVRSLYGTITYFDINKYHDFINSTEHLDEAAKNVARKATIIDGIKENVKIGTTNPLNVRFYICATSKTHLNEHTKKFSIDSNITNIENIEVTNGLWLCINGLPTGICLDSFDHPSYLPFTVIADVMDSQLRNELDSGRKGITQYRAQQIVLEVKNILKELGFINYRKYVLGSDSRIIGSDYNARDNLTDKFTKKKIYDIDLKNKCFPLLSEQEVISLFIELISRDLILGYSPLVLSSYDVYDCLCQYYCNFSSKFIDKSNPIAIAEPHKLSHSEIKKNIVIEFKHKLSEIFMDVKAIKKNLQDIDIIVCWDTEYEKRNDFVVTTGVVIKEVDKSTNTYFGVTHEIIGLGQNTKFLPIIELKTVINSLFNLDL